MMKPVLLLSAIFLLARLDAQVIHDTVYVQSPKPAEVSTPDTVYVMIKEPKHVHLTVLGVGTEHAQVAVIGNIAPKNFSGSQVAAVFNVAEGPMTGAQVAGVSNHSGDSLNGVQLAGCLNTAQGNLTGLQGAGAINICEGDVRGAQLAGAINIAGGNVDVVQAAGSINYATHVKGLQVAGAVNAANGTVTGAQVSGCVNYARHLKGVQVGVFNFADTSEGVMIGLFSFARHGYHKLEFGWNETMPVNAAFHTGSRLFHNIFAAGFDFRGPRLTWGFGYGVGSTFAIHRKVDLSFNVLHYHINQDEFSPFTSSLWKMNALFDIHFVKNLSLAAGPSLNLFVTDLHPGPGETPVTGFVPYYFFTQTYSNQWNAKAWIGGSVSIRFF